MDLQPDQALLQSSQLEEKEVKIFKINQLKSFEILKSALKSITSNTKFMFFMILSLLPLFVFLIFLEIKFTQLKDVMLTMLVPPRIPFILELDKDGNLNKVDYNDEDDSTTKAFRAIFDLIPFHLAFVPLIELFSLIIIINFAAKIYAEEVESTTVVKQTFYKKTNLKGSFITCFWVQLFSISTLFGVVWAAVNHLILTNGFYFNYYSYYDFSYDPVLQNVLVKMLSIVFHALISVAMLYKYLEWSVLWNMSIVISALEEETGLEAFEMSGYYGRHCKETGFRLMLVFLGYNLVLRLPFVIARIMFNYVSFGVVITAIFSGFSCLGSLVKWVAFVLYYYECKAEVLVKKVDDEKVDTV